MVESNPLRAEDVIAWVDACWGSACPCGRNLLGPDAVLSLLLGFKAKPLCIPCLGHALEEEPSALVQRSLAHMKRLDCYRAGWEHSLRRMNREELAQAPWDLGADPEMGAPTASPPLAHSAQGIWDAGDMGCGDLVLELRGHLAELEPGEVLEVHATDPGAPEDLPAWCRITQNPLVAQAHPRYWIKRRASRADS